MAVSRRESDDRDDLPLEKGDDEIDPTERSAMQPDSQMPSTSGFQSSSQPPVFDHAIPRRVNYPPFKTGKSKGKQPAPCRARVSAAQWNGIGDERDIAWTSLPKSSGLGQRSYQVGDYVLVKFQGEDSLLWPCVIWARYVTAKNKTRRYIVSSFDNISRIAHPVAHENLRQMSVPELEYCESNAQLRLIGARFRKSANLYRKYAEEKIAPQLNSRGRKDLEAREVAWQKEESSAKKASKAPKRK